jgi:hypothetical protein
MEEISSFSIFFYKIELFYVKFLYDSCEISRFRRRPKICTIITLHHRIKAVGQLKRRVTAGCPQVLRLRVVVHSKCVCIRKCIEAPSSSVGADTVLSAISYLHASTIWTVHILSYYKKWFLKLVSKKTGWKCLDTSL